jgi:hypothetical protein
MRDGVEVGVDVPVVALVGVAAGPSPALEVARATPYPSAEVPSITTDTMATVATLFTPAPMGHILAWSGLSGGTTHRGPIRFWAARRGCVGLHRLTR